MDKLNQLQMQYANNPQIVKVIDNKFIKRNILWNYLKKHNQIKQVDWQTVKFHELKDILTQFWYKQNILRSDLRISEICLLISMKKHYGFNESEIFKLKEQLNFKLQHIIDHLTDFHIVILKHYIQVCDIFNQQSIQDKLGIIKLYLVYKQQSLLKKMISSKVCTEQQKEMYLQLRDVDVSVDHHHEHYQKQLNETFNNVYQADRNKYILTHIKEKSNSLYNKCYF